MQRINLSILSGLLLTATLVLAGCPAPAAPAPAAEAPAAVEVKATEAPAAEAAATEAPAAEAAATEAPAAEAPAAAGMALPEVDPAAATGDIVTAGSSTVFPLSEAMATRFKDEGYAGNITIDSIGTGAGFERFCKAGETDVANASRAIKDSEVESCKAIGREPIEFRVGTDALAVVVSPENDFLTNVTIEQLAKIFSKDAANWSDVDPSWPAEPILRFSPGTDSGTYDYFVEAVMDKTYVKDATADKGKGEEAILGAANLQQSEDDNVLVQGVEGNKYAIGYFGYAYYEEQGSKLKILDIEGVKASAESVDAGDYKLARPLFIYSDATIMKDKPQVAAFINFYLSFVNEEVMGVGYFPASQESLDAAKQNWSTATGQ